jgi:hypothetical protein
MGELSVEGKGIPPNLGKTARIPYLCGEGKSCTTSSCLIPQGRNAARVGGCSGAMQVAYPFFIELYGIFCRYRQPGPNP